MSSNCFAICLGDGADPIGWSPPRPDGTIRRDCVYFGHVLAEVDRSLPDAGLQFFLTWDLQQLPAYGDDVVAVVLGDEDSRIPAYADRVRGIFKCYGDHPFVGVRPLRDRSLVSLLVGVETARRWLRHLPGDARRVEAQLRGRRMAPIHPIPLGYYNQVDVPFIPFDERTTAVHFAGTTGYVERRWLDPKHWLRRPHPVARREMLDALERFATAHPQLRVQARETVAFLAHVPQDAPSYSQELMQSKIVLAPRGGSVETFRYFEALRAGCVVISEPLPPTWFYHGSPAVTIRRWRDVELLLSQLLADPDALRERHQASLAWWQSCCSERAVANFMVERLTDDQGGRARR